MSALELRPEVTGVMGGSSVMRPATWLALSGPLKPLLEARVDRITNSAELR